MKRLIKFLIFSSFCMPFYATQDAEAWLWGKSNGKETKSPSEKSEQTLDKSKSGDKKVETNNATEAKQPVVTNNDATKNEVKEKDKESNNAVSDIDKKNVAVVFSDGSTISKDLINEELKTISLEFTSRMPYQQLLQLLAFRQAYKQIVNSKAKELNLLNDPEVSKSVEARRKAYAISKYTDEQVEKLMTDDELKKYYNETWDKHIKGTQEISGILISVKTKSQVDRILKEVKNEEQLNKIVAEYQNDKSNTIATMPLDDYPEGGLPPDIVKQIKAKGSNSVVGPLEIQGISTLFFVKSIHPAVKKPFSDEIKEQYKQVGKREFTNRYINNLMTNRKVVIYDLEGKPMDLQENSSNDAKKKKNEKKEPVDLAKIKDDFVIAKIDDKTLKIKDLYEMYNVKTLENELFGSMSIQLKVTMEEVIQSAIKLCVQEKLITDEIEKAHFMGSKSVISKFKEIEEQQLRRAYFNKTVKITEADARKEFNKYMKLIKPEDKDDQEISVKLMFFATQSEADKMLKSCQKNPRKFGEEFEKSEKEKKEVINLGYVRKQGSDQTVWNAVKTSAPAACCPKVIQTKGENYGFDGKNFAVAYVGDRRQIKLPTFQETSAFFRKVAEKIQAVAIVEKLMDQQVVSIDGIPLDQIKTEDKNKILVSIITEDTEHSLER